MVVPRKRQPAYLKCGEQAARTEKFKGRATPRQRVVPKPLTLPCPPRKAGVSNGPSRPPPLAGHRPKAILLLLQRSLKGERAAQPLDESSTHFLLCEANRVPILQARKSRTPPLRPTCVWTVSHFLLCMPSLPPRQPTDEQQDTLLPPFVMSIAQLRCNVILRQTILC